MQENTETTEWRMENQVGKQPDSKALQTEALGGGLTQSH